MFKLHATRLVGREIEERRGEAYTVSGLKYAAANLVYALLHQEAIAPSVHRFVEDVLRAREARQPDSDNPPHVQQFADVRLSITID